MTTSSEIMQSINEAIREKLPAAMGEELRESVMKTVPVAVTGAPSSQYNPSGSAGFIMQGTETSTTTTTKD